jgi:hypothetical protein
MVAENEQIQTKTIDMENKDYTSSFTVVQSPDVAFNAIMNFRGWWSEEIEGPTRSSVRRWN